MKLWWRNGPVGIDFFDHLLSWKLVSNPKSFRFIGFDIACVEYWLFENLIEWITSVIWRCVLGIDFYLIF